MQTARLLPLIWLLTAACSTQFPPSPHPAEVTREIEEVKARVLELQRKASVGEVEVARLRAQVAQLEARLKSFSTPAPPAAPADGAVDPEDFRAPVDFTSRSNPVEESDLLDPGSALPRDSAVPAPDVAARDRSSPEADSEGREAPSSLSPAMQVLYDRGYTLYHQGRYLDAETSFHRFLQSYPGTELADNAQYWIGECRYARGDLTGAVAAFRKTVTSYPHGNKVPDALLKAGQALESLGNVEEAKRSYREIRRRFPESAAGIIAGQRLSEGM